LGYLLSKNFLGRSIANKSSNVAIQYSDFEGLNEAMVVFDLGVNLFFKGHANKLTLNYQNRPVQANTIGELKVDDKRK
jgi:hypothetical protein